MLAKNAFKKTKKPLYQPILEFERGHITELREDGFSFRDVTERLVRNDHDCWESGQGMVLPLEDQGKHVAVLKGMTSVFAVRLWCIILRQLRARRQVACIPLIPNHCLLRRQWCQAKVHWRTEWRSVVFSDEIRFCLDASDGHVLVRRRPGECLQLNCLQPRHTGPTPVFMAWGQFPMTEGALS
ncbi:HTH_38 domain-containing protein [Trichonephila clavipes]|nr:HTH_38 domain-containing protein [Trichonephila clavipes]